MGYIFGVPQPSPAWPTAPVKTSLATVELAPDIDGGGVTLMIDGMESSHHNFVDPTALTFEYMQYMQAVLRGEIPAPSRGGSTRGRPRVLHIGAAGCTMARAVHAEWPGSHQVAIETDEILAARVREWFDLPRSPQLRIRVQDGLEAVRTAPEGRYEVVIRDAFADRRAPHHLTTVEFTSHVHRVLSHGGLYLANSANRPPLTLTRREAATVGAVFDHVSVILEPGVLRGRRYGNAVIVGSQAPLDHSLHRVLRTLPAPARLLAGADLTRFIAGHGPLTQEDSPASTAPTG